MNSIWQDIRYSIRMLRKNPLFTIVAILTLAIGIGANTAIFSILNQVLLEPLPFVDAGRLVTLWEANPQKGIAADTTSASNFIDWRNQNRSFSGMAVTSRLGSITLTSKTQAEELTWSLVSPVFFDLLGVVPQFGRAFRAEEEKPGKNRVVILSYGFWQRYFGGDPNIVGQSIHLDSEVFQVVGILPDGFQSPAGEADLWAPFPIDPATLEPIDRGQNYLNVFARLKNDVSPEQAQQDLDAIARKLGRDFPDSNGGQEIRMISLRDQIVRGVRPTIFLVMGAVGMVLLIGCVNLASLMLTRFSRRSREIAIRAALGASRIRIIGQLLIESLLISLCGGILGILFASWSIDLIVRFNPEIIPQIVRATTDSSALFFALGLSIVTGLIFGVLPALHGSEPARNEFWKIRTGSVSEGRKSSLLRNRFVVMEIALALFLLAGAGLLIRSFFYLNKMHPGFDQKHLLVARIRLDDVYASNGKQIEYFRQLIARLRNTSGIVDAGAATVLPMNPFGIDFDVPYYLEGTPEPQKSNAPKARFRATTPDYFRTMRIPILQGRSFLDSDRTDSPNVVVINQNLAKKIGKGGSAIGKRIRFFWADWQTYEIVGVVGDTRSNGPMQNTGPELFVPHAQIPYIVMNVIVRTTDEPGAMVSTVRRVVLDIDPYQPVHSIETMESLVKDSTLRERYAVWLIGALSAVALFLAIIGIYATVYFAVTQRSAEMGIRMALGATSQDILRIILKPLMSLIAIGIVLGLCGVFLLSRLLRNLLFGISPTDMSTWISVSVIVAAAALIASYIPARRAMKLDPAAILHHE